MALQTLLPRFSRGLHIKAAVARGIGKPFSIENLDLDDPKEGEVLVRLVSSGICHTDIVTSFSLLLL